MQFKYPEILYFLFLLVIPILVHLFQLRRFKREYFTNVDFLKELSIQTRKSSKLKKWLLLCTRLLLLAAIVLAFAQPFFEAKDNTNTTNEMVIVLDNSYSMQAKGKKGELLKRAVEDLLQHVPENQQFSLITNTESYWNTDVKSIKRELQQMQYSANGFDLSAMLTRVHARPSPYKKDVIVITDGVGLDQNHLKSVDADSNTMFIIPEAENKNNVSIDSVYIVQALENFYEIGLTLSAFGKDQPEIPVALYNDGKLVAKTTATATESQSLKFTIPKDDFHGYAEISDNSLQYDNKLYFGISSPQKSNVISIGDASKSNFLSKIFTQDEFRYSNYTVGSVDYNILEDQDAIVLNELTDIPQALQTTLKSFVAKGGNVVIIPAADASVTNLNSFLANFGNIRLGNFETTEKLITKIAFSHPLYSTVFEKKINNFQYPKTGGSFTANASAPRILSYEDGAAFLTSMRQQTATVYLFAAPINRSNSNFQNSPLIVPTFYNMAQNSSKTGTSALTIGSGQPYFVDAQLAKDEIVNVRHTESADAERFIPVQQIMNNKVKLEFGDYPQTAGNYGVYKQEELLKNISFNYSRTEGNLHEANTELPDSFTQVDSVETVFDKLHADRTSNELWKWFVMLALLLLVTEMLIQKFVK